MNNAWKAIRHMTLWGLAGGAGLGALYGGFVTLLASSGPMAGLTFGFVLGGGVGLLLGLFSGLLVCLVNWFSANGRVNSLNYGWTVSLVVSVSVFIAALLAFFILFEGAFSIIMPLLPALIASLSLTYASKRFADNYYFLYLSPVNAPVDKTAERNG